MANILILSDRFPDDMTNGMYLRARNLAAELCRHHRCFFVGLSQGDAPTDARGVPFEETVYFPTRPVRREWPMRHFRFSDSRYLERTLPDYFRQSVAKVRQLASDWSADLLVQFAPNFGEIGLQVGLPSVLDYPDCATLTIERRLANDNRPISGLSQLRMQTNRVRNIFRDRRLIRDFDRTTTISEPDAQRLREVSGVDQSRVVVIPNGVVSEALQASPDRQAVDRSIVFWGNLDFPPNKAAVSYFYDFVFVPFLSEQDVTWHIVGRGADNEIQKIAEHPRISLDGFVEDLYGHVGNMGLMVNPMVEGSGLKNKVLEAFALGLPVVTTAMGVDAISGIHGQHYLVPETPEQFASDILDLLGNADRSAGLARAGRRLVNECYTWSAVGSQLNETVESLLAERCAA